MQTVTQTDTDLAAAARAQEKASTIEKLKRMGIDTHGE